MSIELEYLLELLSERFPNKLPKNKDITIDEIRMLQGSQLVIDYIKGVIEHEERNRSKATREK